ncbi:MAG: PTS sugar transporter subunit IIA, partial [Thermincolia bacterium]
MDLSTLLKEETILLPLAVQNKEECIDRMANGLVQAGFVRDKKVYVTSILARENKGSTGIGFGVAIPHGKSTGVALPGLAVARLT